MRDIVGHRPLQAPKPEHAALPTTTPPSFLERAFSRVNVFGARISSLSLKNPKLLAPHSPAPLLIEKPQARKRLMPRGVVTKTGRVVKRVAIATKEELKKPGRKTSVVHSIALGALFALVLSGAPFTKHTTEDTAASVSTNSLRRYLPNIASNVHLSSLDANKAIAESGKPLNLYGWITPWNVASGSEETNYNAASAFWLTVADDGVAVTPKADWSGWNTYRQKNALSQTYLTVSGDPNAVYKSLSNLDLQSQHIAALLTAVKEQNFDGIDIDYEGLGAANRDLFTGFIRNLTTIFHQQGKKVAVTVEARIANEVPMDWSALGQLADEVRIMAYDYHSHETTEPGPVAPVSWVAEIIAYASARIDPNKLIIGLGNYGYDWSAPLSDGASWEGTGISYDQALSLAKDNAATIVHNTGIDSRGYDIGTIPTFTYTDTQGRQHEVWFEDAVSLQEKVNAVAAYQIKGVMFWSVGAGDPALWKPVS